MLTKHDIEILRPLLHTYAQIAALPIHKEKRRLWLDHNERRSARPMIRIDQVCWTQFNQDGLMNGSCEDPYWLRVEKILRRTIYSWNHFPVDMVINPYISLPKPLRNSGWGIDIKEVTRHSGGTASVSSHEYSDVLQNEEDLEKLQIPEITLDKEKEKQIREEADVLLEGIVPYHMEGQCLHLGLWDFISTHRGVTNCYMDLLTVRNLI